MANKPTNTPFWTNNATYRTEPSTAKKNTGWIFLEKPPFQWFNWLTYNLYSFIDWLKGGSSIVKETAVSYTVLDDDSYSTILVTPTASDVTITLPLVANNTSRKILVKHLGVGAGNTIIAPNASDSITGGSVTLNDTGSYTEVVNNESTTWTTTVSDIGTIPVGTIISFYDFNATVGFDTNVYKYCDGATISDAASPLDGLTLPDLSNRYMVGFGTEGGGDIDTATWASTPVGNASHQVDLQHSHTVASHTHTLSHTHSLQSHTHYVSGNTVGVPQGGSARFQTDTGGYHFALGTGSYQGDHTHGVGITSNSPSTNTSGGASSTTTSSSSPATNNQLSTTQDVQPRSIRVRFLIRFK